MPDVDVDLSVLQRCFEGAIPTTIVTASADGTPNVTYLSRVRCVDEGRIALSNQFFSKTVRNLAENPRASLLMIDPTTYAEYRLSIVYERTEKRGPIFEQLRDDVDAIAELTHMQGVFRLRAADIYRVVELEHVHAHRPTAPDPRAPLSSSPARLAELTTRLARCSDLDTLVNATVDGLAELLGYEHCMLLLLDEVERRLYTIASRGYDAEGVGSEAAVGEGITGMAAARCAPIRVGNFRQMSKYSNSVRRSYEEESGEGPGNEVPMPQLPRVQSRMAVPAMAMGQLVGVVMVETTALVAYTEDDEAVLSVVASLFANAVEIDRAQELPSDEPPFSASSEAPSVSGERSTTHVRFFPIDGSTFLDGDYLIKGVAGRILWSLLAHREREGRVEFTNKEVRLDPTLQLPEFRDNLESRLILLKRRLDEREAPIRIEKTGRGRFRLDVATDLQLENADS